LPEEGEWMFNTISNLVIPLMVLGIVLYGIKKKVNVYDVFVEGAKESFEMVISLFPCLLAMILGINLFLKSDVLSMIFNLLDPFFSYLKIPLEIIPIAIMRPISGSSSLALLNNLFTQFGPDSFIGRVGSVIQGSTETTFYVLTLYFGSVGIKKIRHALWVGLLVDLIGILASIIIVGLFFN
jgi:spore maturation protein B